MAILIAPTSIFLEDGLRHRTLSLIQKAQSIQMSSLDDVKGIVKDALAYLADHPHAELEGLLQDKLKGQSKDDFLKLIESQNLETRLSMLRTYHKIIGLDPLKTWAGVSDKPLGELVTNVALCVPESVPESARILKSISIPLLPHIKRYSYILWKNFKWLAVVPVGMITATANQLLLHERDSAESIEGAKYAYSDRRAAVKSLVEAWEYYRSFFPGFKRGTLLALSGVTVYGGLYFYFKDKLKLGMSDSIDYNSVFTNVNENIVKGKIKKGIDRIAEKTQLIQCWKEILGQKFRIPFLTGPTGAGKTQFVENFAYSCVYDKRFPFYGTTVFVVNTAKLLQKKSLLNDMFFSIGENTDKYILFFDEVHNASNNKTDLIELFKTEILNANVRCVMATTTDEYKKFIASNTAFVSRLRPIEINPFDDQQTKNLLLEETLSLTHQQTVEITSDAYGAIIETAKTHSQYKKFFNPRKSLHIWQESLSAVSSWAPKKLSMELQTEENNLRALKVECYQKYDANPDWSVSVEGMKKLSELKTSKTKVEDLTKKIGEQSQLHEEILHLQTVVSEYRSQRDRQIDRLSKDKRSVSDQKQYLWTQYVVIP